MRKAGWWSALIRGADSANDLRGVDNDDDEDDITLNIEALCLSGGHRPCSMLGAALPWESARRARRLKKIIMYSNEVKTMARKM